MSAATARSSRAASVSARATRGSSAKAVPKAAPKKSMKKPKKSVGGTAAETTKLDAFVEADALREELDVESPEMRRKMEAKKKTPRRRSIRLPALSTFTPTPKKAESTKDEVAGEGDAEASIPIKLSEESIEPKNKNTTCAEIEAAATANPAPAASPLEGHFANPTAESWTPTVRSTHKDICNWLASGHSITTEEFAGLPALANKPHISHMGIGSNFYLQTELVGFKCPGAKREWKATVPWTQDLKIYRDWLNSPMALSKETLFGYFITPVAKEGAKPGREGVVGPSGWVGAGMGKGGWSENMTGWRAWGAGVVVGNWGKALCIFEPSLGKDVKVKKTGELIKEQQLLVGAVKRCWGGCDEVWVKGGDTDNDCFSEVAVWAKQMMTQKGIGERKAWKEQGWEPIAIEK